jgi:uncharacterized membrane protein
LTGRRPWPRRASRDERGAVALVAVVMSFVLIAIAAFAIDIGMQRVARRDMQALADIIALDLARELNGRTQSELAGEGSMTNPAGALRASLARNTDTVGDDLAVDVDWGSYVNGVWNTNTNPPSAVKVVASSSVDFSFTTGSGDVSRTAYGTASSTACYRLGSFVASLNTAGSTVLGPLNSLLGVNLSLASYKALAGLDVTLAELAASSQIGSPDELLTGTITYTELVQATIEALSNRPEAKQRGSNVDVAISALETLLGVSAAVGSIRLGDVLHVSPSDVAAMDVGLHVLDVIASAQLANGSHALEIPNLHAGVAGLGNHISGSLSLISAAQMACGRPNTPETIAKNSQLSGTLGLEFFNLPSLHVPGVGTLQTAKGDGALVLDVGNGTGQLIAPPEVYCGAGTTGDPHKYSVRVQNSLATYRLSMNVTITGDVQIKLLEDLGLGDLLDNILGGLLGGGNNKEDIEIKVALSVGTTEPGATSTANLRLPPNDTVPVTTGSSIYLDPASVVPTVTSVKIGGKTITNLPLVGPLTSAVLGTLTSTTGHFVSQTVSPLLQNLDQMLIGPVATMVGLRFNGADVYAVGAKCGHPRLSG